MRRRSLVAAALVALSAALVPAFGQGLPKVEFSVGGGLASYDIDGGYSGPDVYVDGVRVTPYAGQFDYEPYPASSAPASINTAYLVRWPIGDKLAIAYSNRVAFALDDIIHRGDYVIPYDDALLTLYGLTGLELEVYPKGSAEPGPWLAAVAGVSALIQPFVTAYFPQLGVGGGATAGWRFSRTLALEVNGMYLRTFIPGILKDKAEAAGGSLYGDSSGFTVSAALRFGFGKASKK
jgi:hypothetical protein